MVSLTQVNRASQPRRPGLAGPAGGGIRMRRHEKTRGIRLLPAQRERDVGTNLRAA